MSDDIQGNEWKSITSKDIHAYSNQNSILEKKILLKYALLATLTFILMTLVFNIRTAVRVSVNGKTIGVVPSRAYYSEIVTKLAESYKTNFNKEIKFNDNTSFKYIITFKKNITSANDIAQAIEANSKLFVKAAGIYVNNELKAVVSDNISADNVLKTIKNKYIRTEENASFYENVLVKDTFVLNDEIKTVDIAVDKLLAKSSSMSDYTVKDGDTLWDIAEKNNISVEDLYKLNENKIDVIYPGQVIKISVPQSVINVKNIKYDNVKDEIPFDIKYTNDNNLAKGDRKVVSKGISGSRNLKIAIEEKNGIEIDRKILEEKIVSKPKTEVIAIGSKTVNKTMFGLPVFGTITSRFGFRWGKLHEGIDISSSIGTSIKAAADGRVIFAGTESGYGKLVKVDHGNGYVTYYGHDSKIFVKVGQKVSKGTIIAALGNTGNSTGPHVHFEVRKNGSPIDPLKFLQ